MVENSKLLHMFPQYIKNIIIKTYKRNVQYWYNFWHKNMKNKTLVEIPMVHIFVIEPKCSYPSVVQLHVLWCVTFLNCFPKIFLLT